MKLLSTLLHNGLTVRDATVLDRLSNSHSLTGLELTCADITPANLTRIIDKLVNKGLVKRLSRKQSGQSDRRKVTIQITPLGKVILSE
jgi:DNA-binding MarR family transcriptional regulator